MRAFAPYAATADFAKTDAEGHEVVIMSSIPASVWDRLDVMVEVGTSENAANLHEHLTRIGVSMFAQKTGWAKVTRLADVPTSHREGSLFVTRRPALPWGV